MMAKQRHAQQGLKVGLPNPADAIKAQCRFKFDDFETAEPPKPQTNQLNKAFGEFGCRDNVVFQDRKNRHNSMDNANRNRFDILKHNQLVTVSTQAHSSAK